MKKLFALLLAAVMLLGCASALAEKIALVTDVGTIDLRLKCVFFNGKG